MTVEEEGLWRAIDEFESALDNRDLERVLSYFVEDVVFLGSGEGEEAQSRDAFRKLMTSFDPDVLAGDFKLVYSDRKAWIEGDVAWIVAMGDATWTRGGETRAFPYRLTGVLVRREGKWKWAIHHGSEPGRL